jgi:predicted NAD-dependent protein-ADP-ribosyltransferase YbiA (DUF1768 family)
VDGVGYTSAEHWMMAGKARLFGDDDALARVLAALRPDRGIGVSATDERATDPARWPGANLLGFALMQARELLAAEPGRRGVAAVS